MSFAHLLDKYDSPPVYETENTRDDRSYNPRKTARVYNNHDSDEDS